MERRRAPGSRNGRDPSAGAAGASAANGAAQEPENGCGPRRPSALHIFPASTQMHRCALAAPTGPETHSSRSPNFHMGEYHVKNKKGTIFGLLGPAPQPCPRPDRPLPRPHEPPPTTSPRISRHSQAALKRAAGDRDFTAAITAIAERLIAQAFRDGGKVMLAGNGGSAADAQHIAGEFLSRFLFDRNPLPAIALTTDTSALTAIGNDYGFEHVFERQVRGLGRKGDVSLRSRHPALRPTSSPRSRPARVGIITIGFTGAKAAAMAQFAIWSSPPRRSDRADPADPHHRRTRDLREVERAAVQGTARLDHIRRGSPPLSSIATACSTMTTAISARSSAFDACRARRRGERLNDAGFHVFVDLQPGGRGARHVQRNRGHALHDWMRGNWRRRARGSTTSASVPIIRTRRCRPIGSISTGASRRPDDHRPDAELGGRAEREAS